MTDESEEIPETLLQLIEEFGSSAAVKAISYKEDWVRADYIEPMFEQLGWKRLNPAQLTSVSTGYVREIPLDQTGSAKAPDYGFYVDGQRRFYVEAKKPAVNIKEDTKPALQIRDYGWSASDSVGVVTDFEELALYNCRLQPQPGDAATVGLIDYMRVEDYQERWTWLLEHLSPAAVRAGALTSLVDGYKDSKRLIPVGSAFLAEIESWRLQLAQAVLRANKVTERDLSALVQTLLDRVIFLRIAEARGLEADGTLRATLGKKPIYASLYKLFELADVRYNSGLFHFRKEPGRESPDLVSKDLTVDDDVLAAIVDRLTSPESPYRFEVIPPDILGQIYERFLGKELRIEKGDVVVDHKPEYRKSGGVYYTPTFIVDYIVDRTLGPLLKGKSVNQARTIRVVDPSCGSGSFLISAYQYLLDWYTEKYAQYKRQADRNRFLMTGIDGRVRLRIEQRKQILLDNIFGVDIDRQAVEVAKLSLLLKVIEGESQTALQVERLLPDLQSNVVCGNSLIGTDFYSTDELINLTPEEADKVNALDWSAAFPKIADVSGFDAVVGNPPWLMAGYYVEDSMEYFHRNYKVCSGKADLYYLFLEKSIRIVKPGGRIGMIVPSKLFHTRAAADLREMLSSGGWIEEIVDYGTAKLFDGATNYSCVLVMSGSNTAPIRVRMPPPHPEPQAEFAIERSLLGRKNWHLISAERRELWDRLESAFPALATIADDFGNGVQSGADKVLLIDEQDRKRMGIEKRICRGILRGRNIRKYRSSPDTLLVFPYRERNGNFEILSEQELQSGYPNAYKYLTSNKKRLQARRWFKQGPEELSGEWFGMMYLDEPAAFRGPKLVTPALAATSSFAVDTDNLFVTGTAGVSSILLSDPATEFRYFVLGLLNSKLLSEYIIDHSTPYQGRYFKFSAPYLRDVPVAIPDVTLRAEKKIFSEISTVAQALSTASTAGTAKAAALEKRLNHLVLDLYNLDADERACL